jgi:hypothetical protein
VTGRGFDPRRAYHYGGGTFMASTHDEVAADALPRVMREHPVLFAGKTFQIPSELPAGWFTIVDRLCSDLETLLGAASAAWRPIQCKEKWGSLRWYWRLDLDDDGKPEAFELDLVSPPDPAAIERLNQGDVRVSQTPAGYRISVLPQGELRRAIYARVRLAEQETERTCQWCGEPGTYWSNGWVHVACRRHRREDAMTLDEWRRRAEVRRRKFERGRGKNREQETGNEWRLPFERLGWAVVAFSQPNLHVCEALCASVSRAWLEVMMSADDDVAPERLIETLMGDPAIAAPVIAWRRSIIDLQLGREAAIAPGDDEDVRWIDGRACKPNDDAWSARSADYDHRNSTKKRGMTRSIRTGPVL